MTHSKYHDYSTPFNGSNTLESIPGSFAALQQQFAVCPRINHPCFEPALLFTILPFNMVRSILLMLLLLVVSCAPLVLGNAAPLLEDIRAALDLPGDPNVSPNWVDSYSFGDRCYCITNFDHGIGSVWVDTPLGYMTVYAVCELLGEGPGADGRPLYNDIQCGNGPPNDAGDEERCPGRTEYGENGCKYIGPKWNFEPFMEGNTTSSPPGAGEPDGTEQPSTFSDFLEIIGSFFIWQA